MNRRAGMHQPGGSGDLLLERYAVSRSDEHRGRATREQHEQSSGITALMRQFERGLGSRGAVGVRRWMTCRNTRTPGRFTISVEFVVITARIR